MTKKIFLNSSKILNFLLQYTYISFFIRTIFFENHFFVQIIFFLNFWFLKKKLKKIK